MSRSSHDARGLLPGLEAAVHPGRITCERLDSVESIAREWDGLADRLSAPPFVHPGWFEIWQAHYGSGRPLVLAARRDGRLVGVLALERRGRALHSAANWHSPLFGPLAEDGETLEALVAAAFAERATRHCLMLLDSPGPGLDALRGGARGARLSVAEKIAARSPYIAVEGDFDEYEERLPRKRRKELRRCRRRLEEEGSVSFDFRAGGQDIERLLDEGFAVEGSGWKTDAGSSIASDANTDSFYRAVARWADSRGWLMLAYARVGGRAVAFDFCLEAHGATYALKGGFDPDYARFSPSMLLTYESVARSFSTGLERYELLGTDDAYKLVWADATHERVTLQAFPRTPAGAARKFAHTDGRRLAKQARAKVRTRFSRSA